MSDLLDHLLQYRLVVFDVDGTLYDQRPVRRGMLWHLLLGALREGSPRTILALRAYRHAKEELAAQEAFGHEATARRRAAKASGLSEETVGGLVEEWMRERPLPLVARARFPGVVELFEGLRRAGRLVAVLSDHPAKAKVDTLGLRPDLVVAATDAAVDVQKPHPKGLEWILGETGCRPGEAVLVGDRVDRDGGAAERAGVAFLLRGPAAPPGVLHLPSYLSAPEQVA